jgi:hypothetical protein
MQAGGCMAFAVAFAPDRKILRGASNCAVDMSYDRSVLFRVVNQFFHLSAFALRIAIGLEAII